MADELFGFGDKEELSKIRHELYRIGDILQRLVPPLAAASATLTYTIQGETMATSPLALVVGQTASPTFTEFAADGVTVVPTVGPVTYAADSSGAVTVDPNTGIVTAAAPTAATLVATVTATDASNNISAQATFTVTVEVQPASSATLTYTAGPIPASAKRAVRGSSSFGPVPR